MDLWKECDAQENRYIEHLESCDECRGPASNWGDLCIRGKSLYEAMAKAQELCIAGVPGPRLHPWQRSAA